MSRSRAVQAFGRIDSASRVRELIVKENSLTYQSRYPRALSEGMFYLDTIYRISIRIDKITSLDYPRHHILTKVGDAISHVPRKAKKIK